MKYLAILATVVGAYAQDGSFYSTSYNLNGGDVRVTTGTYTAPRPSARQETILMYQRMNQEINENIARSRQISELRMQTYELREQTELLRKIANE